MSCTSKARCQRIGPVPKRTTLRSCLAWGGDDKHPSSEEAQGHHAVVHRHLKADVVVTWFAFYRDQCRPEAEETGTHTELNLIRCASPFLPFLARRWGRKILAQGLVFRM